MSLSDSAYTDANDVLVEQCPLAKLPKRTP